MSVNTHYILQACSMDSTIIVMTGLCRPRTTCSPRLVGRVEIGIRKQKGKVSRSHNHI